MEMWAGAGEEVATDTLGILGELFFLFVSLPVAHLSECPCSIFLSPHMCQQRLSTVSSSVTWVVKHAFPTQMCLSSCGHGPLSLQNLESIMSVDCSFSTPAL